MVGHVDGNALAGPLSQVFTEEITDALARCAGCGSVKAIGETIAYMSEMGSVLRCPGCDSVLMVVTQLRGSLIVGSPGITFLRLPLAGRDATTPVSRDHEGGTT